MRYTETGAGSSFPYPSHEQDPKIKQEKPEKFLLPYARAAYYDFMQVYGKGVFASNGGDYEKYRLYGMGKQPNSQYKASMGVDMQTNNTWLSVDWSIRSIIPTYRDKTISRLMEQEHGIVATPIDALSKTEVTQYVNELKAKLAVRQLIAQTNQSLASHPMIALQGDDPMDSEELEMRVEMNEQFNRSKDAEMAIELGFYENDYKHFRRSLYEDLFDYGVAGYKEWLGDDGKAKFRKTNPNNIIISYCRQSNFTDMVHAGELLDVPLVDLATVKDKEGNDVFSAEELKEFAETIKGRFGNPQISSGSIAAGALDKFKCKVLELELFTYDDYVWKTAPNMEGNQDLRKGDYGRRSEKFTRKRLKCVYKVKWVVGTDKCYDFGLCYDQKRPNDVRKKGDVSLSYRFFAYNFYEMRAQGFMERIIPYADEYMETKLRMQNWKNRAIPSGFYISLDGLENVALNKGGKNMQPKEILQMFAETGILVGRHLSADGTPLFQNQQPVIPIQSSILSELVGLYQDLERIVMDIERIVGFNDTTNGNVNPKTLVPGIESAQLSTSHAIYPLLFAETYLSERLAEDVLLRMQQGIRKFGSLTGYATALNTNTLRFIELNGDLAMRDYGIKLEAKTTDEMKMWVLQQMQGDIANGYLDTSDAILILNTHNVKQAMTILQHRVKKAKEAMQQQEMQKIQAGNEGNMQAQQAAQQAKLQELQIQVQLELQKQQMATNAEIEKERLRQQTELEKERLRYTVTLQKTDADNQAKLAVAAKQNEGKVEAAEVSAQGDIEKTHAAGQYSIAKQQEANKKPHPKSTKK